MHRFLFTVGKCVPIWATLLWLGCKEEGRGQSIHCHPQNILKNISAYTESTDFIFNTLKKIVISRQYHLKMDRTFAFHFLLSVQRQLYGYLVRDAVHSCRKIYILQCNCCKGIRQHTVQTWKAAKKKTFSHDKRPRESNKNLIFWKFLELQEKKERDSIYVFIL